MGDATSLRRSLEFSKVSGKLDQLSSQMGALQAGKQRQTAPPPKGLKKNGTSKSVGQEIFKRASFHVLLFFLPFVLTIFFQETHFENLCFHHFFGGVAGKVR